MPSVRVSAAEKKLLRRAARALARHLGHAVTEGETVAEGAQRIIASEKLLGSAWKAGDRPRLKPGAIDPFFDLRSAGEVRGPTSSTDVDEILYGRVSESRRRGRAKRRPRRGRAGAKR